MTLHGDNNRFERRMGGVMFAASCLTVIGVIDAVLTPAAVLIALASQTSAPAGLDAGGAARLIAILGLGWSLAGLMIALAALLRVGCAIGRGLSAGGGTRDQTDEAARPAEWEADAWTAGGPPEAAGRRRTGRELLAAVREIRDLILAAPLDGEDGQERIRAAHQRQMAAEIIDAVNQRQIGHARSMLDNARAIFGQTPTLEKLAARLDETARRCEPLDYARTRRLVDEAALEGRWVQAEAAVRALYFDHPEVPRCRKLWEDFRRVRLHAYIEEVAGLRHWAEAQAAAEEFIARFPDTPEAASLREQLDTLRHNAGVEIRKRCERRVQELIADGHYAEAARVARYLIQQYPDSPQAAALKPRLADFESRAAQRRDVVQET
ncbi:MAG: hypothetical protein C4547_09220 [Phycisphaerales bacterium]|nr:MAG: hypothetical protein C4547_09220 [Phycisphaerales bacterium]